jgi:hypothetical protein
LKTLKQRIKERCPRDIQLLIEKARKHRKGKGPPLTWGEASRVASITAKIEGEIYLEDNPEGQRAVEARREEKRANDRLKIWVLVDENPKKKNTKAHDRFELYKDGIMVTTFLRNGGKRVDIDWDVTRGFIAIAESDPRDETA